MTGTNILLSSAGPLSLVLPLRLGTSLPQMSVASTTSLPVTSQFVITPLLIVRTKPASDGWYIFRIMDLASSALETSRLVYLATRSETVLTRM